MNTTSIQYSFQSVGIKSLVRHCLTNERWAEHAVAALEAAIRRDIPGWPKERMVGEGESAKVKEIKQPKATQKTGFGKQGTTAKFGSGAAFAVPSTLFGQLYSADAVMALAESAGLRGAYTPHTDSFLAKRLVEWLAEFIARCAEQENAKKTAAAAAAAEQAKQLG